MAIPCQSLNRATEPSSDVKREAEGLSFTHGGIQKFMTNPRQFLGDIYAQLGDDEHAALALVYLAAKDGDLSRPLELDEAQRKIIVRALSAGLLG